MVMVVVEFSVGDELFWLKGDCHIVAKVIEVEKDRVKLSGITKDYWMKKRRF